MEILTKRILRDEYGKTCTKCEQYRPYDEFYRLSTTTDGRQSWCKVCTRAYTTRRLQEKRQALHASQDAAGVPRRDLKDARKAAEILRRTSTTRTMTPAGRIYYRYKVTLERAAALAAVTHCENCDRELGQGRGERAVDHDYLTGQVRGVLCPSCNTGIGKLGDTLESVEQAALYLVRSMDVLAMAEQIGR